MHVLLPKGGPPDCAVPLPHLSRKMPVVVHDKIHQNPSVLGKRELRKATRPLFLFFPPVPTLNGTEISIYFFCALIVCQLLLVVLCGELS